MEKGIVYVYTNKENGMQYYGRTLRPTRRFLDHLNANLGKHNTYDHFHQAIRDIGCQCNLDEFLKYFTFEVLDTLYFDKDTKAEVSRELDKLEAEYIQNNNSIWPNGYNEKTLSTTKTFTLTDEQKKKALENRKQRKIGFKKDIKKLFFETEEERLEKHIRQSDAAKKAAQEYWSREENIAKKEETKRRQQIEQEKKKKAKEEYWNSEEGQERIAINKKKASDSFTSYNKSEAHRLSAIESNKRRWANGCPEETRQKMRDAAKRNSKKGMKWKIDPVTQKRVWY